MKCYLINLDRSAERLALMAETFSQLGLDFVRIPAVDGRQIDQAELNSCVAGEGRFYRLGSGEIGCFLSHRKFWEIVATGEDDYAIVFEDDVHLSQVAKEVLSQADWIPAGADIVKLETTLIRTLVDRTSDHRVADRRIVRLRGSHQGTAGYIVSRNGARKLLSMSETFADPVDQFMFNSELPAFKELTIYQMEPALCAQDWAVDKEKSVPALGSLLKEERPLHLLQRKGTAMTKLKREITRPFERLGAILGAILRRRKFGAIPFR